MSDAPTAEQLLADATWLRRLALTLAGNAADADDLVQESWIAAWQRKPGTERSLRPWLAKVIRDLAGMKRRSERRRAVREQSSIDDEPVTAPDVLLEQMRLHRLLVDLVLELVEPYRSTIIARFVEGRTAASIARGSGVAESTVRGRLREGLARLRAQLDAAKGERAAWAPAVLAFAKGGLQVAKPTKSLLVLLALLALLIGVGGPSVLRALGRSTPGEARSEHGDAVGRAATLRGRGAVSPGGAPAIASWLAAMGGTAHPIGGRVVDEAGVPIAGATVDLQNWASAFGDAPEGRVVTGSDGAFRFQPETTWNYVVLASAPDRTPAVASVDSRAPQGPVHVGSVAVTVPDPEHLVLVLAGCTARAEGIVTDAGGGAIAGATVQDLRGLAGPFGPQATTAQDGRYSICLSPGDHRLMFGADGYEHVWRTLRAQGRQRVDVELGLGATVMGQVVDADRGTPIAGVQIGLWPWTWHSGGPAHRAALSGADGRFEITDVGAGRFQVSAWDRDHVLTHAETVTVEPAQRTGPVVLRLDRGVDVAGVVRMAGKPVPAAIVTVAMAAEASAGRTFRYTTNPDGSFVVHAVSPYARATIDVESYEVLSPASVDTTHGSLANVVVDVVAGPRIHGHVVYAGKPVADAEVRIRGPSNNTSVLGDNAGRFEAALAPGSYKLMAVSAAAGAFSTTSITVSVPTSDDITLELDSDARITGRVIDGSGAAVVGAEVVAVRQSDGDRGSADTATDGSFAIDLLAGRGEYKLAVRPFAGAPQPFPWHGDPPPRVTLVDSHAHAGPIQLVVDRAARTIAGSVLDDVGSPVSDAIVHLGPGVDQLPPGPAWPTAHSDESGRFTLTTAAPGPFTVEASLGNGPRGTVTGVAAGTSNLVITLVRTGEIRGALVGLANAHVWLRRLGGSGSNATYVATVDGDRFTATKLLPGQYVVAAVTAANPGATATVTVESGAVATVSLRASAARTVTAHVSWFGSGGPVAGASCTVAPASGLAFPPAMDWASTHAGISDSAGLLRIDNAPTGDVVLWCARSQDHTTGLALVRDDAAAQVVVVRRADESPGTVGIQLDWTRITARVLAVAPSSPAQRAGIQPGDLIISVDRANVETLGPEPVMWLIGSRPRGTTVAIGFDRGGTRFERVLAVEPDQP